MKPLVKSLGKKLLKLPFTSRILAFLIVLCLRVIYASSKKTFMFPENVAPYFSGEQQAIYCFWHGRMIMHAFLRPKQRGMKVLISHHRDGTLILRQEAAAGHNIAMTPDGPRGPAYVAAHGAAHLAMVTGLPIIPVSFSTTRAWRFQKSWDHFMMPKPFGRIIFCAESPIHVAPGQDDAGIAAASSALSDAITRAMQQCDAQSGAGA
jgi:lysophospholipid acyltransferase (LPLAT)-like uncharacterized protein